MSSFMIYDLIFLIAFTLFVVIFLYIRRRKIQREGIMYLYRTKIGLKIIDYFGKKHEKFISKLEYVIISVGYLLMAASLYMIGYLVYFFIKFPDFVKAVKIPPIAPLIPYLGEIFKADYLPPFYFTYWIIVLAVTAIFHEFFHGILARKNNVKIKSTGFAFLGPFMGAFVEQDDKQMKKIKTRNQISILAGGSFANLLITILFFFILAGFFYAAFAPSGAVFNYYSFNQINTSDITRIENTSPYISVDGGLNLTKVFVKNKSYLLETEILNNLSLGKQIVVFEDAPAINSGLWGVIIEIDGKKIQNNDALRLALLEEKPGNEVIIKTFFNNSFRETSILLGARPDNSSQAYLGIANIKYSNGVFSKIRQEISFFKDENTYYTPKAVPDLTIFIYNLLWWMLLINLSVALFNMLPVGIFDGGRVFYLTVFRITKSKKIANFLYSLMTYAFIAVFALLTIIWFVQSFI